MKCRVVATLLSVLAALSCFGQVNSNIMIVVDPADAFTGSWSVEWNTNADFEGWVPVGATAVVLDGTLQGTAATTDSQVQRTGFADGPDLGFGEISQEKSASSHGIVESACVRVG